MTELNDTLGALEIRELRDDELDDVAGGGPRGGGGGLVSLIEKDVNTVVQDISSL